MRFLLGDELLAGVYDVATVLRPQRSVRCVDTDDATAFVSMMTHLCQVWLPPAPAAVIPAARARLVSRQTAAYAFWMARPR